MIQQVKAKSNSAISIVRRLGLLAAVAATLAACATGEQSSQPGATTPTAAQKSRFDVVQARGKLVCGVSGEVPGFSFVDKSGKYSGIDVDICRAIASALFDNPDAVEYRNLTAKERFTALQTGEIDILSRNTTWTASRDTANGFEFAPVVFYDGQGMMVRKDSGFKTLADMKGASICAQIGTTTELNLADQMRKLNVEYKPLTFEDINATFAAYQAGRCTGVTADRSALIARRSLLPKPEDHVILDSLLSQEPLAPAVLNGDSKWSDTVKWIVYSTIAAEQLGITSKNLDEQTKSTNAEVKRFLGIEGELGKGIGLSNDFAARVVKHVGNYSEIYDRNLGPTTKFNLPRGLNKLAKDGGIMYAPPFR
jgi:general L-amino acid transport system substrate-binding protein